MNLISSNPKSLLSILVAERIKRAVKAMDLSTAV